MDLEADLPVTPLEFEHRVESGLAVEVANRHVLAAVSGGADSVALLRALDRLRKKLNFKLSAAHLDHGLRGEFSSGDARFVERLCRGIGVPLVVESVSVPARVAETGETVEEAARICRYAFLRRTAVERDCEFVAVAHTADDQIETILHHILRGTGLSGLRGMPAVRELEMQKTADDAAHSSSVVFLIRPLLAVRRDDVEDYLRDLSQEFRRDVSNSDVQFTRNRIRGTLLPMLRREFNPRVEEALLRLGGQAGETAELVEQLAADLLEESLLEARGGICRLDRSPLRETAPLLVRTALMLLWKRMKWPRQRMGFAEWERTAELVRAGGAASLPEGIDARTRGEMLVVRRMEND